jgi:8-oxoguanine deaminase
MFKPKTMLVKNAVVLVTMDEQRREIKDGGLFIDGRVIVKQGIVTTLDLPQVIEKKDRIARELVNG